MAPKVELACLKLAGEETFTEGTFNSQVGHDLPNVVFSLKSWVRLASPFPFSGLRGKPLYV